MPSLDEADAELVEGTPARARFGCADWRSAAWRAVDRALAELVPEFSRSYLQQLLAQGLVALNGKPFRFRVQGQGG
jgi:23S rRNA pseudouridine1911/1915/1917 synthase